jgi:uncharacterized protein (TIGR01777 family)
MSKNVLITGGTGLIGTRLTELLLEKGYTVAFLSRKANTKPDSQGIRTYHWDIAKGEIDTQSILEADYLIHLAGAGVADKRWTDSRKQEIIDSRTQSTKLLAEQFRAVPHKLKAFISASAVGIYGADTGTTILTEATSPGADFLSEVTQLWETGADEIAQLSIRTVKLRIGIVLSEKGGALAKIAQPIRLGAGSALGSGKQYLSWIHLDDMARLFIYAIENEQMRGIYNAVAPNPVTNEQLTQLAAKVLKKPLWLPNVPAFALRLAFGELSEVILGGNYVLNKRIAEQTAFSYEFTDAEKALQNLLS